METMRGLAFDTNTPLGVELRDDLAIPTPRAGEVRVRVTHTTVNGHEFELAKHPLVRLMALLRGAWGPVRTGLEFAGIVDTDGTRFQRGQRVMGYVEVAGGMRPHADYVTIPEAYLGRVADDLSLAEASTLPMSGLTALGAVRDVAKVQRGQQVLVLGASGGVGVLAVQIARLYGASVTAMASSAHHERLEQLGAETVLDYRETPLAELTVAFDAVLDFSDTLSLRDVRHLLAPSGVFVPADPMQHLWDIAWHKPARYLLVDRGETAGLDTLSEWVRSGALTPVTDQEIGLDDWQDAITRSHTRGRFGRTILSFAADPPVASSM